VAAGIAGGVLFVRRQAVVENPLLELSLFRARAFNASLLMYTLATFVTFGMFVLIAQYLQAVHGLSPLAAGLWTAPSALAFIVGSQLAPLVARRARPASVMLGGLALAALGFALLTRVNRADGLALLVTAFVVLSLGVSQVFTLANDVIIGVAPPERAGAAAAISETGSELGGALGIAILGSIGSAAYRSRMLESAPANLPASVLRTAGDTVGAALAIAEELPAALQFELAESAREAFASSLRLTASISGLIVVGIGILGAVSVSAISVGRVHAASATDPAPECGRV
jgi:DHA2 family multidrug resistance protein-like MFS transporter